MKVKALCFAAGLLLGVAGAWIALPRYTVVMIENRLPMRYDRISGKTWILDNYEKWEEVVTSQYQVPPH